jgi:hypothetical protein
MAVQKKAGGIKAVELALDSVLARLKSAVKPVPSG